MLKNTTSLIIRQLTRLKFLLAGRNRETLNDRGDSAVTLQTKNNATFAVECEPACSCKKFNDQGWLCSLLIVILHGHTSGLFYCVLFSQRRLIGNCCFRMPPFLQAGFKLIFDFSLSCLTLRQWELFQCIKTQSGSYSNRAFLRELRQFSRKQHSKFEHKKEQLRNLPSKLSPEPEPGLRWTGAKNQQTQDHIQNAAPRAECDVKRRRLIWQPVPLWDILHRTYLSIKV